MKRKTHLPALFVMGIGALGAGCGQEAGDGAAGTPVSSYHAGAREDIALNLKTQRNYAQGSGIRQSASQVGNNDQTVDYGLALRTAAIKLNGRLPTMAEMSRLEKAVKAGAYDGSENDPSFVYADLVKKLIADPAFQTQVMAFWRNTLRMGPTQLPLSGFFQDSAMQRQVLLDTAPAFLTKLTVEGRDMTLAFTNTSTKSGFGNCPSYNESTNVITNGNCFVPGVNMANPPTMPGNGVAEEAQAGVLTNPGFMAHYYSNMGFRRARLIQELFGCSRYPSEFAETPQVIGPYVYSSPWPVNSVPNTVAPTLAQRRYRIPPATPNNEFVSFAEGCQACHTTSNRRAALFAVFDQIGYSSNDMNKLMVVTPVTFSPYTQLSEYYPANEKGAWKYQKDANNFVEFGAQMAKDPEVHRCFVTRIWNHAYSRDDVVNELALVPPQVTADLVKYFTDNGFNLKMTIEKLYTDPNFIRF